MSETARIVRIDKAHSRTGTCRLCGLDRTVFPVVDSRGVWTWACTSCSAGAEDMP